MRDAMSGRVVGMQNNVGRTAEEAQRRVQLAPLTSRDVAQLPRRAAQRLVGAPCLRPKFQQFRRRKLPAAESLDVFVHPASGELEWFGHVTAGCDFRKLAARS